MSVMELKHTKFLVAEKQSKRIFTGQNSYKAIDKLYHFAFVILLSSITFGIWFLLLLIFKGKYYHPNVTVDGTSNPIDTNKITESLKSCEYSLKEDEKPLAFINIKKKQFILFTSENIYYQLLKSDKNLETDLTRGRVAIQKASNIKTKSNFIDSLSIMLGDEIIGSLSNGNDERIIDLLSAISKDIREGNQ